MSASKNSRDSTDIQTHLLIIQGVINRMAGNSSTCKILCVTLVAAICAVAASSYNKNILWISILPIVIFCLLDMFYLSLEKGFREQYNLFVKKIHTGEVLDKDFFLVKIPPEYFGFKCCLRAFRSWSIWIVYPGMLIIVFILCFFICNSAP